MTLLNEQQAANELQVSRQTLFNWRKDGCPHYKRIRFIRYELDKVLDWLKKKEEA